MSFPKYPKYKPSGVDWLGDVPAHWEVDRIKHSALSCRNGIWGDEPQQNEDDIPCIRVADFDREKLRVTLNEPTIRNVTQKEREGRVLSCGDLLLEKSGGGELQPVGCVVRYEDDQLAICSNFVARVQMAAGMDTSFWRYVHAAAYAVKINTRSIKQTSGIQNLDASQYFDERAPFPPLSEQTQIATFLDRETAKIDALVAEQRRLIELLKEKRQAVISHAVTRGLNPSAPLKPSGIDWLGDVPAHWEIKPLKYLISLRSGGTPSKENIAYWYGDVPWASSKDLKTEELSDTQDHITQLALDDDAAELIPAGSILTVVRGMILLHTFPVTVATVPMAINQDLKAITARSQISSDFLTWLLRGASTEILNRTDEAAHGTKVLRMEAWLSMPMPVPPIKEQKQIVSIIRKRNDQFGILTAEAERAITLLQERRTALISAAVTGQINVY